MCSLLFPTLPLFLSLPLSLSTPAKYVSQPIYNKLSFPSNWISSLAAFVGWVTHFSLILFLFYPKIMYCITRISLFPARFSSLQPTRALNLVLAMESNYTLSEGCIFYLLKSPKNLLETCLFFHFVLYLIASCGKNNKISLNFYSIF